MSPETPTTGWPDLGPMLKARRLSLGMSRAQVSAAGGPSPATQQRIENGAVVTDVDTDTKISEERALQLPPGWINEQLGVRAPASADGVGLLAIEGDGERLLVAITDGASRLSFSDRRAVLALVRELQKGSNE